MGDHLKKVQAGAPFKPSAKAWNSFIDAAQAHQAGHNTQRDFLRSLRELTIIPVKNSTGAARDRFAAVALGDPIITPTDNADEFQNRVTFVGNTPAAGDEGKFAILLEPAAADAIVPAAAAGVTVASVNVTDADHAYAEIATGLHLLQSGDEGAALILWKESGTGQKWAIVRIGRTTQAEITRVTGIEVNCSKTVDVNLSDDNAHFYTLHAGDWRGRHIHVSALYHSGGPGTNPFNVYSRTPTRDDLLTDMRDWVQPEAVYLDLAADMWIYAALLTGSGDALNAYILVDGDDGGKLKLEVSSADSNRYQFWIRADATAAKDEDAPDITAPDA